jgi:hypothetical protein
VPQDALHHVRRFLGHDPPPHRIVKNLCREVTTDAPTPKATPHHRWFSFNASDCPKSVVGAGQLPLLISLTIINTKLYHVLINGGAALNLINLATLKKLQIPMSKLQLSGPFFGVGPIVVIPCGCIFLLVTFGTPENFFMESVLFDLMEVSLPFITILSRLALY